MAAIIRNRILSTLTLAVLCAVCFVGAVDDITNDLCRSRRV